MATATTPRGYRYQDTLVGTPNNPVLHIQQLAEDIDTDVQALADRVATVHGPDDTYPNTTTATSSEVVHNRITIPAATYARIVDVSATLHLTYSAAGNVDSLLYADAAALHRVRVVQAAAAIEHHQLGAKVAVAAGDGVVIEARFYRTSGAGTVTPSTAAGFSAMSATAIPA